MFIFRFPVVSCGNGCKPQGPMVNKSVSYTCMPKKNNKKADFIIAKIHAGKIVPELKSYPETFKSQVQMPVTCTKA